MYKAFALLPLADAAHADPRTPQIIALIQQRPPAGPVAATALALIGAGTFLLAIAQLRRPALSPAAEIVEQDALAHGYPPRRPCRVRLRRVK